MNRKFAFIVAMIPAVSALAELNPVDTRWTFGAHEPFPMYRRVGRICTGAIEGNALWLQDWPCRSEAVAQERRHRGSHRRRHRHAEKYPEIRTKIFKRAQKIPAICRDFLLLLKSMPPFIRASAAVRRSLPLPRSRFAPFPSAWS